MSLFFGIQLSISFLHKTLKNIWTFSNCDGNISLFITEILLYFLENYLHYTTQFAGADIEGAFYFLK